MSQLSKIIIFSDRVERYAGLVTGAKQLGEEVSAIVIGTEEANQVANLNVNKVYALPSKQENKLTEDYVQTLAAIIEKESPELILLSNSKRGKVIAARLGIVLKANVINDAVEISVVEGSIYTKRTVYGGLALAEEKSLSKISIVTVGSIFEEAQINVNNCASVINTDYVEKASSIKVVGSSSKQSNNINLAKAKRVIGIGRGIAAKTDIDMVKQFADRIDAEIGCSRPIAEGENWMERERYIGVSGVNINADLYIALGISGQIQHMAGTNSASCIVAVNKDKNAAIFNYADYGIIGDLYKVVPALIKELNN